VSIEQHTYTNTHTSNHRHTHPEQKADNFFAAASGKRLGAFLIKK